MERDWAWLQPSWAQLESWQQRQQQAEADCGSWNSSAACSCCGHSSSSTRSDGEWLSGAPSFDDTWPEQVVLVPTRFGPLRVTISGDRRNHPLLTYHDIALDHASCFGALFRCPDTAPLLRQHFCVFHVDAPGHEVGATSGRQQRRKLTADDLAEQVADVISHFSLPAVTCLGVTAGAYILTLLAIKRPALVRSLILVSPVCRTPTWSEWAFNKFLLSVLSLYGLSAVVAGAFSGRYLSPRPHGQGLADVTHVPDLSPQSPPSQPPHQGAEEAEERDPHAVAQYADAFNNRRDITEAVQCIACPVLVLVGEHSAFRDDAMHLHAHLPPHLAAWFQVPSSGSLITVECPHRLCTPLDKFLRTAGYSCPPCSPPLPSALPSSSCPPPFVHASPLPLPWASSLPPRSAIQYRPHSCMPLSLQHYDPLQPYSLSSSSSPSSSDSPHASSTTSSSYSSLSHSSCVCLSPPSPSSSTCHSPQPSFRPEDLSLDAIGRTLKPIRTRIHPEVAGVSKGLPQGKPVWC
ncbi:hypothetical protein CLOM_g21892 [Closterium sp. NIES-68]|nr:hypothetical protein CLOM_g21892 [Closterium sp. NIES-68]GJP58387.1 hypothetical protein CLOP_g23639 [Closterium sp. NIES-67]